METTQFQQSMLSHALQEWEKYQFFEDVVAALKSVGNKSVLECIKRVKENYMSVFFGTKGGTYGSIRIFESDH